MVQVIPQERLQERIVEQIVDVPVCVGDTGFKIIYGLHCEVIRIGFRYYAVRSAYSTPTKTPKNWVGLVVTPLPIQARMQARPPLRT